MGSSGGSSGSGTFKIDAYGADPTGATDSTAAVNAALAAMPTRSVSGVPFPVGCLMFGQGTYRLGTSTDVTNLGPFVSVQGVARSASIIDYRGAGSALRVFNSVRPPSDTFATITAWSGTINEITIDGTNCQAGASGLRYGDTEGGVLGPDLLIKSFNKSGCDGMLFDNQYSWTENLHVRLTVFDCTTSVRFHGCGNTAPGGDVSFMYNDMTFKVYSMLNQDGVVFDNGAYYVNSSLKIRANVANHTSAQTSALVSLKGVAPVGHSNAGLYTQIANCHLEVQAESDGTGTFAPRTIYFEDPFNNALTGCEGVIAFLGGKWAASNWSLATNFANGSFTFSGWISGDANLSPVDGGAGIIGTAYYSHSTLFADGGAPLHQGDFFGPLTLSQNITVVLGQGKPGAQRKTFIIKQAATGGPYTVTWPKPGSPVLATPAIYWAGGTAPTMTATANATDVYNLTTTDGVRWYGIASQNVS